MVYGVETFLVHYDNYPINFYHNYLCTPEWRTMRNIKNFLHETSEFKWSSKSWCKLNKDFLQFLPNFCFHSCKKIRAHFRKSSIISSCSFVWRSQLESQLVTGQLHQNSLTATHSGRGPDVEKCQNSSFNRFWVLGCCN